MTRIRQWLGKESFNTVELWGGLAVTSMFAHWFWITGAVLALITVAVSGYCRTAVDVKNI